MYEHRTQFVIHGDIEELYNLAIENFTGLGYSIDIEHKPNNIIFIKRGSRWTSDIRNIPQKLSIFLIQEKNEQVRISLIFNITIRGRPTKSGVQDLESISIAFKNLIISTIEKDNSL